MHAQMTPPPSRHHSLVSAVSAVRKKIQGTKFPTKNPSLWRCRRKLESESASPEKKVKLQQQQAQPPRVINSKHGDRAATFTKKKKDEREA